MRYTLEPIWKKSVTDIQNWFKEDGERKLWFEREYGWRWGSASFESEEFPDIDLKNDDGFNVTEDLEYPDMYFDDGCWSFNTFCDELTEEEKEQLQYMDDEELEENGWTLHYIDTYYSGPLKLTDENGNEWRGDDNG